MFFNKDTEATWIESAEGIDRSLSLSPNLIAASEVIAHRGLIRTTDWMIAYGRVYRCTVKAA